MTKTAFDELEDPFRVWCRENSIEERDEPAAFGRYIQETTGFVDTTWWPLTS